MVTWRCELGHEWSAAVYQRTLSGSGCPDCYRLTAAARSEVGRQRARDARNAAGIAEIAAVSTMTTAAREAV